MGVKAKAKPDTCNHILESACARNTPVELHQFGVGEEVLVARSRLLGLDERRVYLDKPEGRTRPLSLGQGSVVDVHMLLAGKRYVFQSPVAESECTVQLNTETTVRGISLSRPTKLDNGQRRENFRVSLVTQDTIAVALHETGKHYIDQCSLDTPRFSGRLLDLSRGGVSVRVDVTERRKINADDQFFVHCRFPDNAGEVTMLAEVRHVRSIVHGEANRVGLRFITWCPAFTKPQYQTIRHLCADLQRRSIQRAR